MSSPNKDYQERRNFIRMFIDAKIKITDPETREVFEGDSKNLSGDGIMFTTEKAFALKQQLQLDISSQQSRLPPLNASFEVVRMKKLENGLYEIGGRLNTTDN